MPVAVRPPVGGDALSSHTEGNHSALVHRVRFVDWQPAGISALAFGPPPPNIPRDSSDRARSLLAVAREDGTVELHTWCQDAPGVLTDPTVAKGYVPHTVSIPLRHILRDS